MSLVVQSHLHYLAVGLTLGRHQGVPYTFTISDSVTQRGRPLYFYRASRNMCITSCAVNLWRASCRSILPRASKARPTSRS